MLLTHLHEKLRDIATTYSLPMRISLGDRCPIISFNIEDVNPFDLSTLLSTKNVNIRAGM